CSGPGRSVSCATASGRDDGTVSYRRSGVVPSDLAPPPGRGGPRHDPRGGGRVDEPGRRKRAPTKRKSTAPRPAPTPDLTPGRRKLLLLALNELAGALAKVLEALEDSRWPGDGGAALSRCRDRALTALGVADEAGRRARTWRFLEELAPLVDSLR